MWNYAILLWCKMLLYWIRSTWSSRQSVVAFYYYLIKMNKYDIINIKIWELIWKIRELVKFLIPRWKGESSVVDTVPYRPVRPEYTVPAGDPVRLTPTFRTGKNTGRTGQYQAIRAGTKFFFFFLSFVIFEFLLGKNGNLFALTY